MVILIIPFLIIAYFLTNYRYTFIVKGLPYKNIGLKLDFWEILKLDYSLGFKKKKEIREVISLIIKARNLEIKEYELVDFYDLLFSKHDVKIFGNAIINAESYKFKINFHNLNTYHRSGGDVKKYIPFWKEIEKEGLILKENKENSSLLKKLMLREIKNKSKIIELIRIFIAAKRISCKIDLKYLFSEGIKTDKIIEIIQCAIKCYKEKIFVSSKESKVKFDILSISLENFLEIIALKKDINLFANILIKLKKSKIEITLQTLLEFSFAKIEISKLFDLLIKSKNSNIKIVNKSNETEKENEICLDYLLSFHLINGNIYEILESLILIKKANVKNLPQKKLESYFIRNWNLKEIEAATIFINLYGKGKEESFNIIKDISKQNIDVLIFMKSLLKAKFLKLNFLNFDFALKIAKTGANLEEEIRKTEDPNILEINDLEVTTNDGYKIIMKINLIYYKNLKNFFSKYQEINIIRNVKNIILNKILDLKHEEIIKKSKEIEEEVLKKINSFQNKNKINNGYFRNENGLFLPENLNASYSQINNYEIIYEIKNVIIRDIDIKSNFFEELKIKFSKFKIEHDKLLLNNEIRKAILDGNKDVTNEFYKSKIFKYLE